MCLLFFNSCLLVVILCLMFNHLYFIITKVCGINQNLIKFMYRIYYLLENMFGINMTILFRNVSVVVVCGARSCQWCDDGSGLWCEKLAV